MTENHTPMLEIRGVTKQYRNVVAVDAVTFAIPRGSIFGLLGPNGAGKTTLIRMITTIIRPDGGEIIFDGQQLNNKHPEYIGYLPEERGLYRKMKVGEQLLYLARLKGLRYDVAKARTTELLKRFEILDWWHKKVEELSKGMQQKVQFISTIIHQPKLIILDEPFTGLDPINTNLIKQEIRSLNERGTTVIFSTHRMEQVEEICERIVLIHKGRNILEGNVAEIKDKHKQGLYNIGFKGTLPPDLHGPFEVISDSENALVVKIEEGLNANQLLQELLGRGFVITSFHEVMPTLNEIFIQCVENGSNV